MHTLRRELSRTLVLITIVAGAAQVSTDLAVVVAGVVAAVLAATSGITLRSLS